MLVELHAASFVSRAAKRTLVTGLALILIYLLTAIGWSPGGSSTVHIYTQTVHRTKQNTQYIEQNNNFGRVRAVPHLGELYPGICLTTKKKHG
jgi:hypothetical protein